jgi:hypothetical protein
MNAKSQRPKESMFGRLHHSEEVREVHDASHIGFGELDAAGQCEFVGHRS